MADWLVDVAEITGGFATAIGVVIALASLWAIYLQARSSERIARETTAIEAHKDYIKLCLERPALSSSSMALEYTKLTTFDGVLDSGPDERVEEALWFLSYVLFAMEQILSTTWRGRHPDRAWLVTVEDQLGYHQETLRAVWPEWRIHYNEYMQAVVERVLASERRPSGLLTR